MTAENVSDAANGAPAANGESKNKTAPAPAEASAASESKREA